MKPRHQPSPVPARVSLVAAMILGAPIGARLGDLVDDGRISMGLVVAILAWAILVNIVGFLWGRL